MAKTVKDHIVQNWPKDKDLFERWLIAAHLSTYLVEKHQAALAEYRSPPSYVLNLDARYGLGKTRFLDCWAESLRASGAKVICFNAWDSDYSDQALLSFTLELMQQLEPDLPPDASVKLKAVWEVAKRAAAPVLLGVAVRAVTGMNPEALSKLAGDPDQLAETAGEIVERVADKLLDEFKGKRAAASAAKAALTEAIGALQKQGSTSPEGDGEEGEDIVRWPVFVFIDELDRCRPNYAIEVLESIKHVFQVPGVHFVVATDRQQLARAVGAVYGESFDGAFYLRRFFDRQLTLPPPSCETFAAALFQERFPSKDLRSHFVPVAADLSEPGVRELFARLMRAFEVPLRCQIQIADEYEICSSLLRTENKTIHAGFLLPALCLKSLPKFHDSFQALIYTPAQWTDDYAKFGVPADPIFASSDWSETGQKHTRSSVGAGQLLSTYARFFTTGRIVDEPPAWICSIADMLAQDREWLPRSSQSAAIRYLWDVVAFSAIVR